MARRTQVSPHVAADNAAMAQVPDGATVVTALSLLAPLAARTGTFWIGNPGLRVRDARLYPETQLG